MKPTITFICVLTLVNFCHTLQLPSTFKKCDKRKTYFNQCLSEAIQDALKQLKEPFSEHGLPQLEPLIGPEEMVAEYGDETTSLRQKYTHFKFYGLTNVNTVNATFDFEKHVLFLNISFFEFLVAFDYEMFGRFILLPIDVSTTGSCNLVKPLFKMSFNLEKYQNEKQSHYRVTGGGTLKFFPEAIKFEYKDIFKNKSLNDEINKGMSENWETITVYWQGMFPRLFMDVFEDMFDNLLKNVPVEELFNGL